MARRGKHGLPAYVSPARDRHGRVRLRFRKGSFSTYITAKFPSPEFWQDYQAACEGVIAARRRIGVRRHKPGSIAALVLAYYAAPEFQGLRPSTRATYRGILDRFVAKHGDKPVAGLERQHIKALIGGYAATPSAGNNLLRMLRMVLNYAVDAEMIARNPARGVRGFKIRSTGFKTWTEANIGAFERRHAIGTKPRLAMALMLYLGQRRGDVVRLGWQHVTGETIRLRQEKTGVVVTLLIHSALIDALAATSREHLTFLVTEYGAPFTAAGFGNWFRERCNEAGLADLSAHGLRKAAARRLAEAGNSSKAIAAVTGHGTLKEIERYTRDADQQELAGKAIASMPDRTDREQNLPNPPKRLDKTGAKKLK